MVRWTLALSLLLVACGGSEPAEEAPAEEDAAPEVVDIPYLPCKRPSVLFDAPEAPKKQPNGLYPKWSASDCRVSKMPKLEDWPRHPTRDVLEQRCSEIDFDGDGDPGDKVWLEHNAVSGMAKTWGWLYETGSQDVENPTKDEENWFNAMDFDLSELTTFDANYTPEELYAEEMKLHRALLEDAAFPRNCRTPDPLAQWLVRTEPEMAWFEGSPAVPPDHAAVYQPTQQWVWMKGGKFKPFSKTATEGKFELYTSNHAVAVKDTSRDAWAVVWVYRGGTRALDKASVGSARFDGPNTAVLQVAGLVGDSMDTVKYDLRTGKKIKD